VADNATEAGRAENRRTTVRLERSWGDGDLATR
jgi:outer membrane protein OmpA-like peptidoglycan-associated protein